MATTQIFAFENILRCSIVLIKIFLSNKNKNSIYIIFMDKLANYFHHFLLIIIYMNLFHITCCTQSFSFLRSANFYRISKIFFFNIILANLLGTSFFHIYIIYLQTSIKKIMNCRQGQTFLHTRTCIIIIHIKISILIKYLMFIIYFKRISMH